MTGCDRYRSKPAKAMKSWEKSLETLARLEAHGWIGFCRNNHGHILPKVPRDATVVPVMRQVTPQMALALGGLVQRGFLVTAVVVAFEREAIPEWAHPPEWAELLLAQGIDFRMVNSEESIMNLCAEAIVEVRDEQTSQNSARTI